VKYFFQIDQDHRLLKLYPLIIHYHIWSDAV
jgi:hypothetical protein